MAKEGTFKRVAVRQGDTLQLCFMPADHPRTLAAYDDSRGQPHMQGRGTLFLYLGRDGIPLALEANFIWENSGIDIPVYSHSTRVGAFRFVPEPPTPPAAHPAPS